MAFKPTLNITIGQFRFPIVVELEIVSTWRELTDNCTITFPRKFAWKDREIATGENPLIKRGDQVSVELGYDDQNTLIFSGFAHQIKADIPVVVKCQDHMWLLKKNTFNLSYQNATLSQILQDVVPDDVVIASVPDITLGRIRFKQMTPAKILDKLRSDYFIRTWFRNGTLYSGFAYRPELSKEYVIRFNRNVIEHDLEYFVKENNRIKLKMVSIDSTTNSKVEYEVGDPDGDLRTKYYYDLSLNDLKIIADEEIERLRYDGFKGSITVFGQPTFFHGYVIEIVDDFYPERNGRYLIDKVTTKTGVNGFTQTLHLDIKV